MNNKILSVSIASYNIEQYIEKTISSLLIEQEEMEKLEIIIVNDGSKDNTSKIAHNLEKQYPESIVVIDKKNGGYGSTINESLKVAKGKYYKLLDGDDWYNKESLEKFVDYLEKTNVDLVITPYYEVKKSKQLVDSHKEIPKKGIRFDQIKLKNNLFVMHELAIKTDLLRSFNRRIAEKCFYTDAEFVFYCITASKSAARFDMPLYCYRLGVEGQSVSLDGIRKHYKDFPVVAKRLMDCYDSTINGFYNTKKEILNLLICNFTYQTYRAFMLLDNPQLEKSVLVKLDKNIKRNYPISYKQGNNSKLIWLSRVTRFIPYGLLCRIAKKKFLEEFSY